MKGLELRKLPSKEDADSPAQTRFVALVIDELSDSADNVAREVLNQILKQLGSENVYFCVWRIRDRVRLVQPFTRDEAALRRALSANNRSKPAPLPVAQSASPAARSSPFDGELIAQRILKTAGNMVRDQHARPTAALLFALAREQRQLPARKTVLYVSDGLQINSFSSEDLFAIAGEANRSEVSFYSIDTSGVTQQSVDAASNMARDSAVMGSSMAQIATSAGESSVQHGKTNFNDFKHPQANKQMKMLASETGGVFINASSNLQKSIRHVAEDVITYYEATYSAPKQEYDGHFCPMTVRVDLPRAQMQTRGGYFSLPPFGLTDVAAFELPLLSALTSEVREETIWLRAGVLRLGRAKHDKTPAALIIQTPLNGLVAREDETTKRFRLHLSVLALVRGRDGTVIQKFSQDVALVGPLERLQQSRKDVYTFQRSLEVLAGDYRVDIAVADQNANKLSTKTLTFSIPASGDNPIMSDLVVVRSLRTAAESDGDDLLRYKNLYVVPELNGRGTVTANAEHPVFFRLFPDGKPAERAHIELELKKENTIVTRNVLDVAESDNGEGIPILASFPASNPEPGDYELAARVTEGGDTREQHVNFIISGDSREDQNAEGVLQEEEGFTASIGDRLLASPKLIENAIRPSDSELKSTLSGARQRVLSYKHALPAFICLMLTKRFLDSSGQGAWKLDDSYTSMLRYDGSHETTLLLDVNGKRVRHQDQDSFEGATVRGEFGDTLNMIFSDHAKARIEWLGMAYVLGARTHVFRYSVAARNSEYLVVADRASAVNAAYHALVYVDVDSLNVKRLSIEADDLPANFPIKESAITIDYDYVPIAGQDYLLPLEATLLVRVGRHYLRKNEIQFQNYRKYGAESRMR